MSFKYDKIVPWGRNYDEYIRMFELTNDDLKQKILGCADGPSSFNAESNNKGANVISVDPIYSMSKDEIQIRIDETYKNVLTQTARNAEKFIWNAIRSIDDLGKIRMRAMTIFLNSYEHGKINKRYIPGLLPNLPFANNEFKISLSPHFLFLYTENLTYDFHLRAIEEMLRVSNEARIFPLLDVNGKKSRYVERIIADYKGRKIEIKKVDYEFQIGGNELLIIYS